MNVISDVAAFIKNAVVAIRMGTPVGQIGILAALKGPTAFEFG